MIALGYDTRWTMYQDALLCARMIAKRQSRDRRCCPYDPLDFAWLGYPARGRVSDALTRMTEFLAAMLIVLAIIAAKQDQFFWLAPSVLTIFLYQDSASMKHANEDTTWRLSDKVAS